MNPSLFCVANAHSAGGFGETRWRALAMELERAGIVFEQAFTDHAGHAIELAREASRRHSIVLAAGGDGLVHEVATGVQLGRAECTVATLPCGTGNDIAQLLGLRTTEDLLGAIKNDSAEQIDLIRVTGRSGAFPEPRFALLFGAVGFSSELARKTTPAVKRIFGARFSYQVGFLRALWSFRPVEMTIEWDGGFESGRKVLACVANAEWAGGHTMRLAPGADWADGWLNVLVVDAMSPIRLFVNLARLAKGAHINHPKVRTFLTKRLDVRVVPPVEIQADGESFGQTPVRFEVVPRALRLLAKAPRTTLRAHSP